MFQYYFSLLFTELQYTVKSELKLLANRKKANYKSLRSNKIRIA